MKKKAQKKDLVFEQDRIMAAFAKVNLREAVDPLYRGKIVEDEETYNKVQQLLDCPEMEHAHQFLLDVDFEDLTPDVKQKVDDLYQLAVSEGYFQTEASDVEDEQPKVSDESGGFEDEVPPDPAENAVKDATNVTTPTPLNSCAFTLFYSAMKNGEIKTGECYSNATTMDGAKLDAVKKLQKLGFTAVEIIAAEECDPNARGCAEQQPDEFGAPVNDEPETDEPDVEEVVDDEESEDLEDEESEEDAGEKEEDADEDDDEDEDDEVVGEAEEKKEEDDSSEDDEEDEPSDEEKEDAEPKELSRSEKLDYFKRYLEEFKALLKKMKAETYADMALSDRAKFYSEMSKIWKGKPDPAEFMSDDNVKQIEHMKIKLDA